MTAPNDTYPQPAAQPNVAPSAGVLTQPQAVGQNHAAPGSFVPSSNALQGYFPRRVLSRHHGRAWIIPIFLPAGLSSLVIDFEYEQLGVEPGVKSIGYRGSLASGEQVTVTDLTNAPMLLAFGTGAVPSIGSAIMPALSYEDRFQVLISTNQSFSQGDAIILYQEEQVPFTVI